MLQVQEYLYQNGLEKLVEEFKLEATHHPILPLVLLKYNQCDSPKYHEITRECRSLVLRKDTWAVYSKSFRRFYNLEELEGNLVCPNHDSFNWNDWVAQEKLDGSLINLFNYHNCWYMTTSGSWGLSNIGEGCPYSWRELFFSLLGDNVKYLDPHISYVFELRSPYNKVVQTHKTPSIALLSSFNLFDLSENTVVFNDYVAEQIGVYRPQLYNFKSVDEVRSWFKTQHPTFEGCVFIDKNFNRLKVKNPPYVHLHHMHDNGNICNYSRMIPLALSRPQEMDEEFLAYFEEIRERWNSLRKDLEAECAYLDEIYCGHHKLERKPFALAIQKLGTKKWHQSVLFAAYKRQEWPSDIIGEFENLLIKIYKEKNNEN